MCAESGLVADFVAVAAAPFTGRNFQFPDSFNMLADNTAKFGGDITS
jgi:hypothetical protein